MCPAVSILDAFDKENWDFHEIKVQLQKDSSKVNKIDGGQAPLHRVLEDQRCSADIVKLLLFYGADPNMQLFRRGPTPLILSLYCKDRVEIIKVLVEAGARAHKRGDSSLSFAVALQAELKVFELLLRAGADFTKDDGSGQCPLFHALGYKDFNVAAYRSLLDLQVVAINALTNQWNGNLLHSALDMNACTTSFVSFLIDRGISVNLADKFGNTPLHVAVQRSNCQPEVIVKLLKSGSSVDAENNYGETALDLALQDNCTPAVIKLLLDAGASLVSSSSFALEAAFSNLNKDKESLSVFLIVLKYGVLECPDWVIETEYSICDPELYDTFSEYVSLCIGELSKMEKENVGNNLTLLHFLKTYRATKIRREDCIIEEGGYDADILFDVIALNSYPIYSDVISAKFARSLLEAKLEERVITSEIFSPDMSCVSRKVTLDIDCMLVLANYLSDMELLNVNLAF